MGKYVVLHGHFFLPPLEDVWTGLVYDLNPKEQYQNLYKKVAKTCLGANSASRVLGGDGRIRKIINNYGYLSFSFDPGLLAWLKTNAPNVYKRIQAGDAQAIERLGHGNALATLWTHSVAPLQAPWERDLQIDWGLAAFEEHFGRKAEGFWLPHQAVNPATLDALIQRGIGFVVLDPRSAQAVMPLGDGNWIPVGDPSTLASRCFQLDRPGGSLRVFFAHPGLSGNLGAGGLLKDAGALLGYVRGILDGEKSEGFTSAAVSGLVFGYKEPFGDMCLAAFFEKVKESDDLGLGNYGYLMDYHPPKELVKLHRGEDELGVSGACHHGVARWHRSCGCVDEAPQGWHQNWRTGLREALVSLRDDAETIFFTEIHRLSRVSPQETREAYIQVLLGQKSPKDFVQTYGKPDLGSGAQADLLRLLEGINLSLKMFISSGWDPADLSRREATQVLFYASRLCQLYEPFSSKDLLFALKENLHRVQTNDPGYRTGAQILEKLVWPQQKSWEYPTALLLLDTFLRTNPSYDQVVGPFKLLNLTRKKVKHSDQIIEFSGEIQITHSIFLENRTFDYILLEDLHEGVSLYLKDHDHLETPPQAFDLNTLPSTEKEEILQLMTSDLENFLVESTSNLLPKLKKAFVYGRLLGIGQSQTAKSLMEVALNRRIVNLEPAQGAELSEVQLQELEQSLHFAQDYNLNLDREKINRKLSYLVSLEIGERNEFTDEPVVKYLSRLLTMAWKWGFDPDLTVPQALIYETIQFRQQEYFDELDHHNIHGLEKLRCLTKLGALLGINVDTIKDRVFEL